MSNFPPSQDLGLRKATFDNQTVWCDFVADAAMICDVIDLLVRDLPVSVSALLAGADQGDLVTVARSAHKVVGAAGTVAADPICEIARAIEFQARNGSHDGVAALREGICVASDQLIGDLLAWRRDLEAVQSSPVIEDSSCRS